MNEAKKRKNLFFQIQLKQFYYGMIKTFKKLSESCKSDYVTSYYSFIIFLGIVGGCLLNVTGNLSFIDTFFFSFSSLTLSGFVLLELTNLTLYQQIIIYIISILSSTIFVNLCFLFFRLRALSQTKTYQEQDKDISFTGKNLEQSNDKSFVGSVNPTIKKLVQSLNLKNPFFKNKIRRNEFTSLDDSNQTVKVFFLDKSFLKSDLNLFKNDNMCSKPNNVNEIINNSEILNDNDNDESENTLYFNNTTLMKKYENYLEDGILNNTTELEKVFEKNNKLQSKINKHNFFFFLKQKLKRSFSDSNIVIYNNSLNSNKYPNQSHQKIIDFKNLKLNFDKKNCETFTAIENDYLPSYYNFNHKKLSIQEQPLNLIFNNNEISQQSFLSDKHVPHSLNEKKEKQSFSHLKNQKPNHVVIYSKNFNDLPIYKNYYKKDELNNLNYNSTRLLIKIVLIYFLGFQILSVILYLLWIYSHPSSVQYLNENSINEQWWAIFLSQSTFTNLGMTLNAHSLIPFKNQTSLILLSLFFLILGDFGFSLFIRVIIWIIYITSDTETTLKKSSKFILDHPRNNFALLFPSKISWSLFYFFNFTVLVDFFCFMILEFNYQPSNQSKSNQIISGLFQSLNSRIAGFIIFDIKKLHPAMLVSFIVMMFISSIPMTFSIRKTNENIKKYIKFNITNSEMENVKSRCENVQTFTHIKTQVVYDLVYIMSAFFLICIAEKNKINDPNSEMNHFTILFETVSLYSVVGLSLNVNSENSINTYTYTTFTKLIFILLMIKGKQRKMPVAKDSSVSLPKRNISLQQ